MEGGQDVRARRVGVQFDVVAGAIRGEQSIDAARLQQSLADHLFEQFPGVGEKFARFFAVPLVIQYGRIPPAQFPGVEERRPVDERDEVLQ